MISIIPVVIFCNTCRKVKWLTENMRLKSFTVSAMHGELDQCQRELIMDQFHSGSIHVLITTDMLPQCIDIRQVSLVINYDFPSNHKNYIQRIRRSGCFSRKGIAINFITEDNKRVMKDIELFYNTRMLKMPENVADLL